MLLVLPVLVTDLCHMRRHAENWRHVAPYATSREAFGPNEPCRPLPAHHGGVAHIAKPGLSSGRLKAGTHELAPSTGALLAPRSFPPPLEPKSIRSLVMNFVARSRSRFLVKVVPRPKPATATTNPIKLLHQLAFRADAVASQSAIGLSGLLRHPGQFVEANGTRLPARCLTAIFVFASSPLRGEGVLQQTVRSLKYPPNQMPTRQEHGITHSGECPGNHDGSKPHELKPAGASTFPPPLEPKSTHMHR